jgi:hypothetical protein
MGHPRYRLLEKLAKKTHAQVRLARALLAPIYYFSEEWFKMDTASASGLLAYPKLFYPIIVFDGKMWLAEKTDIYGKMDLTKIDHVCVFFNYLSGKYNIDLYIDVVQKDAFEKFFDSIVKDIEILRKAIYNETGNKFRKEVMEAVNWYKGKKA